MTTFTVARRQEPNIEEVILDGISDHIEAAFKYHGLDIYLELQPGSWHNTLVINLGTDKLRFRLDLSNATLCASRLASFHDKQCFALADPNLFAAIDNEINDWFAWRRC